MDRIKILFFTIFLLSSFMYSQQIEIEKINDTLVSQFYTNRDNIIIEDDYIYALSVYGLEIYEVSDNDSLILLSQIPFICNKAIVKKDSFVYISSGYSSNTSSWGKLYKINVSNPANSIIDQTLEFDFKVWPMELYGEYLNLRMYDPTTTTTYNHFYSLPELSLIADHQNFLKHFDKLDSETIIRYDGYNQFTILNISDPSNPVIMGSGDISNVHSSNVHRVILHEENTLIFSQLDKISIWDVTDWNNWQFLSDYSLPYHTYDQYKPIVIDNKLILVEDGFVELLDISEPSNLQQLCLLQGTVKSYSLISIDNSDNDIFISTLHNGIQWVRLNGNDLSFIGEYAEIYPSIPRIKDDYIFTPHILKPYQLYNFSDPYNHIFLGEFIPNYYPDLTLTENRLGVYDTETFKYDIYNVSVMENAILTNSFHFNAYHKCRFDKYDHDSVYFLEVNSNEFSKYDISTNAVNDMIFNIDLSFAPIDWLIHDDYAYFLEVTGQYSRKLYIYEDLDSTSPTLCNEIDNFASNPDYSFLKIEDEFLVVYTDTAESLIPSNRTRFFDISIPDQPEFVFSINAFGEPFVFENLIFASGYHVCYVFEKPTFPVGGVEPFYSFCDISNINDVYIVENGNTNVLLLNQASHIGVYTFDYTQSHSNEILKIDPDTFSNHPNPFNPSTKITYSLNQSGKISLKIYNAKGQKVVTLVNSEQRAGTYDITWDGKGMNKKAVSSGVYYCRLCTAGQDVSRKMILLK